MVAQVGIDNSARGMVWQQSKVNGSGVVTMNIISYQDLPRQQSTQSAIFMDTNQRLYDQSTHADSTEIVPSKQVKPSALRSQLVLFNSLIKRLNLANRHARIHLALGSDLVERFKCFFVFTLQDEPSWGFYTSVTVRIDIYTQA